MRINLIFFYVNDGWIIYSREQQISINARQVERKQKRKKENKLVFNGKFIFKIFFDFLKKNKQLKPLIWSKSLFLSGRGYNIYLLLYIHNFFLFSW